MQIDLNRLGSAGEHLDAAERALAEDAFATAREAVDRADVELEAARAQWRDADGATRALLGRIGKSVGERRNALAARLPALSLVSEGTAEPDDDDGDEETAA